MSRAFVKEPDGDETAGELQDLPISPHPNYVTPAGLAQLEARLAALEEERGAHSGGDFSDQPALTHLAREIRYVEARLATAQVIDPADHPAGTVGFGNLVTVEDEAGGERRFAIVGEDEADPAQGKISWVSPLARALRGAKVGDLVTWQRPSGDVEIEIKDIEMPGPLEAEPS